ncbi:hypothetical protein D3C85_1337860 [compost metagenome]
MGHQMLKCKRRSRSIRDLQIRQVGLDILVQINLSGFSQLHNACGGEQLGYRSQTEQCFVSVNRPFCSHVSITVALVQEHLSVLDDDQQGACQLFLDFLLFKKLCCKGCGLSFIQLHGGRGCLRV